MRDAASLDSMTLHGPYVFPDSGVQRGNLAAKSQSTRLPTQLHPSDSTFFETVLLHFLRHRREETAATATASALPHAHICPILRGSIIIRRS